MKPEIEAYAFTSSINFLYWLRIGKFITEFSLTIKKMIHVQRILAFSCILFMLFFLPIYMAKSQTYDKLDSLLLELYNPHHDTIRFDLLLEIGDYYYFNDFETAKDYFTQAKELAEKNIERSEGALERKFLYQKAKAIRYIAYVFLNQGDQVTASDMYFQALEIGEKIECYSTIYNCYNNIGIINHLRKDYGVAEEYYRKAIEITEKSGDLFGRSKLLINMGVLNYDHGNDTDSIPKREEYFKGAYENYLKALNLRIEINDLWGQVLCYNNLGNVTRDGASHVKDDRIRREKLLQASHYYRQSFRIAKQIKDLMTMSKVSGNLSKLQLMLYSIDGIGDTEKGIYSDSAKYFATESYRFAEELKSLPQQHDAAFNAKITYATLGDIKKELEYANIFIEKSMEMFSEDKTRSLDEMRIKYETEKKENEIRLQQLTIQKKQFQLLLVLLVTGIFVLVMIFLGYVIRQKHIAEKLLAGKNTELQQSNATKDKFFSIISHDLRTPVSGFRNLTTLIGEKFDLLTPDQLKESIFNLNHAAEETISMLNNLLHWARSQQKIIEVKTLPVNIKILCNKVFDEQSVKLKEKDIIINDQGIGLFDADIDENIVSTVLRNLLSNAIKFSPRNSTIDVNAFIDNSTLHISIKDRGIGMTEEDQKKLFRIECDTKSIGKSTEKGSGLGLIICKELATLHGGTIEVESRPEHGSTFTLKIPISSDNG